MAILVTADLHLTDNPKDAYRWELFPWLIKKAKKYKTSHILILGDLTNEKDRHPSTLVNRICQSISYLPGIKIVLKGNHDFLSADNPFFGFLRSFENINFISKPEYIKLGNLGECLFLPSAKNWEKEWDGLDFKACHNFIFTHQPYDGCISENGTRLGGVPPSIFKGVDAKIISGDIHVPQKIGKRIEYVGAPYRIRFGDEYKPRVMLIKSKDNIIDLHFPAKNKVLVTIKDVSDLDELIYLSEGDQVKVRVRLKRSEYPNWPKIRSKIQDVVKEHKLELCGLSLVSKVTRPTDMEVQTKASKPDEIVRDYAERYKLKKSMLNAGLTLLKEG